ncbi:MAG: class I tRNA ligase family protein, partial [Nitrospirota bacterium]
DTVRIFSMFAAPPERDLEWSDQGVEGALRFLNRIWTFIYKNHDVLNTKGSGHVNDVSQYSPAAARLLRKTHQTIKKVTNSIERDYHFNTAIAALMELVNEILTFTPSDKDEIVLMRYAVRQIVLLLSPFAPHFSEELWSEVGDSKTLFNKEWPSWDDEIAKDEEIELVVQINGKVRAKTTIAAGLDDESVRERAFSDPRIQELIQARTPRKVIVVQGRLVNIVL